MNPVDRPLLNIGLTRLEFLSISGKGLAGLTIAPALLSLLGCKQEDIDSGTVGLINTPKGVLVTQRARCTGCHRCEISCTNFNDGSVGTFFSRIKIHRNYTRPLHKGQPPTYFLHLLWRQRGWLWRWPVWRSQLYRGYLPSMQRAAMHERLPDWCDYLAAERRLYYRRS